MAFVEDCPASPLAHLLASRGSGDAFVMRKYSERRPISVSIYLTRACNLRCLTCYEAAGEPLRGELGPGWMRIIEGLADLGVSMLTCSEGSRRSGKAGAGRSRGIRIGVRHGSRDEHQRTAGGPGNGGGSGQGRAGAGPGEHRRLDARRERSHKGKGLIRRGDSAPSGT